MSEKKQDLEQTEDIKKTEKKTEDMNNAGGVEDASGYSVKSTEMPKEPVDAVV